MAGSTLLNTDTEDLKELLSNGKSYSVPPYQRDYSWKEEPWEDLWEDLTMIEAKLQQLYPDLGHAVVAVPDKKKGEQLVMFTTLEKPDRKKIADALKSLGVADLMIPKMVFELETMPMLGSGKTDYVTIARLAKEKVLE